MILAEGLLLLLQKVLGEIYLVLKKLGSKAPDCKKKMITLSLKQTHKPVEKLPDFGCCDKQPRACDKTCYITQSFYTLKFILLVFPLR